jgi:hypothetical protein
MADQFEIFCKWAIGMNYAHDAPWSQVAKDYKEQRLNTAATSPGPTNCNVRKTAQREFRPLDGKCERCGRYDDQECPFFTPEGVSRR